MLDVIVYENNNISFKNDIEIINAALMNVDIDCCVYKYEEYRSDVNAFKIFIVNIDANSNYGLKLAKLIRNKYHNSMIILMSDNNKNDYDICKYHLMVFDFIDKTDNYKNRLKDDLLQIVDKFYNDFSFIFKYNRVIYRLPYSSINYIEKETNIKRCIIHTINGNYYIVSTIGELFKNLNNKFIRTHQSCIVNVDNIKALDCKSNSIIFNNEDGTSLLNENAKKQLKELMIMKRC